MPLWNSADDDQAARRDLSRRLRKLERLFHIPEVRRERLDAARVAAYYAECHAAYRKHHSPEGAAHMALNQGGRFDPDGFAEHLRRIEARWGQAGATPPRDVIEIGFGQGYNLAWLAPRHPGIAFRGIDLTPEHLQVATTRLQAAGITNATLMLGDFHHLPLADASVDEVYAIEAFCYARDVPQALAEIARVLRPGGRFTLFDGYQPRPTAELDPDGALAVELVARGTALERWQVPAELVLQARQVGFQAEQMQRLDLEVMPNLRRLERLVGALIRWPWLARRALARRAPARSRNVLSGYLLHRTVAMGLLSYEQIVLKKAG
jgi:tocopherol O-methyltransferase